MKLNFFWGLYLLSFLCLTYLGRAQTQIKQHNHKHGFGCRHTELSKLELRNYFLRVQHEKETSAQRSANASVQNIPVMFHIVRNTSGDGVSAEEVEQSLERVNDQFEGANIQFYQCSDPNIIVSNSLFDTEFEIEWSTGCNQNTPEYQIDSDYGVPNVLNIYCVNTNGWSWASFPWLRESHCYDWIILAQNHVNNHTTLAHEFGHYFGLLHTWSGKDENVTRNPQNSCYNCETEGDLLCDTPADHHESSDWNPGCDPDDMFDDCGVLVQPDGLNIMSYARHCPVEDEYFTDGQNDRMNYYLTEHRDYLSCSHDCVENYTLNGQLNGTATRIAWGNITSTTDINSGASVHYEAGNEIRLLPGFQAESGSNFLARIMDCIDDADNFSEHSEVEDRSFDQETTETIENVYFKAYPSPFNDQLTVEIKLKENNARFRLFDLYGKTLKNIELSKIQPNEHQKISIDTNDLIAGIYFAVLNVNGEISTVKIIKSK